MKPEAELNEYLCPVCGSDMIECVMDDVGEDGFKHENCGCKACGSAWYNHYQLIDQEVVIKRGHRLTGNPNRLIIELTSGRKDACGDCDMVSMMLAGSSKNDLAKEYRHVMPNFYFTEE